MEKVEKNQNVSSFFLVLIPLSRDSCVFLNANAEMSCSVISQPQASRALQEQIWLFEENFIELLSPEEHVDI